MTLGLRHGPGSSACRPVPLGFCEIFGAVAATPDLPNPSGRRECLSGVFQKTCVPLDEGSSIEKSAGKSAMHADSRSAVFRAWPLLLRRHANRVAVGGASSLERTMGLRLD
jgi:hypothetical protein